MHKLTSFSELEWNTYLLSGETADFDFIFKQWQKNFNTFPGLVSLHPVVQASDPLGAAQLAKTVAFRDPWHCSEPSLMDPTFTALNSVTV